MTMKAGDRWTTVEFREDISGWSVKDNGFCQSWEEGTTGPLCNLSNFNWLLVLQLIMDNVSNMYVVTGRQSNKKAQSL